MTGTHRTTIDGVPAVVHYELYPARKGSTDGRCGPRLEPDELAHIELMLIEGPYNKPWAMAWATKDDEARIVDEIAESLERQARSHE